ncbi:DUF4430 domain-containing protein [Candidatus Nomurabacteria bacterium]|nr:DUF4430 domain-containing protein [Candidatus Nomurabacteria bacterium]
MQKSKIQKNISIIFAIVFAIFILLIIFYSYKNKEIEVLEKKPELNIQNKLNIIEKTEKLKNIENKQKQEILFVNPISVNLIIGNYNIKIKTEKNTSFYDILMFEQKKGELNFSGKSYPDLGFFVSDINDLHGGNGKYLFYYVNGKEASVGVSYYIPQDGDIIEWKLK